MKLSVMMVGLCLSMTMWAQRAPVPAPSPIPGCHAKGVSMHVMYSCVRQVLQKEKWDADQSYHVAGEGRPPRGAAFPLRAARLRRPDRFSASSPSCVPPDPPY